MKKIALFLAALLCFSCFAGTVALADAAAPSAETEGSPLDILYYTVPMKAAVEIFFAIDASGIDAADYGKLTLLATKPGSDRADRVAPSGYCEINGRRCIVFVYDNLAANEMGAMVSARVVCGEDSGNTVTHSVKEFAESYLAGDHEEKYKELVRAMIAYGEAVEGTNIPVERTYALNDTATFVKLLDGRQEATADHITCDYTASGIEFIADCSGTVSISLYAENKLYSTTGKSGCYFRAYVDGAEYLNGDSPYYFVDGESAIALNGIPSGTHTIKLVKATGYTLSRVDLKSVTLFGEVIDTAPADKDLYIEFVGDSISCGWGVVGDIDGDYDSQDGTLAYPYMVSEKLGADYSIVALSGQGIIYGAPGLTTAYKYNSALRSVESEYSFSRKADVIVINADSNDAIQGKTAEEYGAALEAFVEYARAKNPDAHIILIAGAVKDNFISVVSDLAEALGGSDSGYYFYQAKRTAGVENVHPTASENLAYTNEIAEMIRQILHGVYNEDYKADDPALTEGADIRVMSYNVLNPKWNTSAPIDGRDDIVAEVIKYYMPDVVGVQETAEVWHNALKSRLVDTGYYAMACAKTTSGKYNMTTFLYNPETLRLVDEYVIDLDAGSDIRVFAVAVFEKIADGERFVVTNTHPAPASSQPENYARNFASIIALVGDEMAKHEGLPVIMTGDFNTKEQAEAYTELMSAAGVKDAKYEAEILRRDYSTARAWGAEIHAGNAACIDHIFVNDEAEVKLYNVVIGHNVDAASDHIPIYADIAFN